MRQSEFDTLARRLAVHRKKKENIYAKYSDVSKAIRSNWIDISFLPDQMMEQYREVIRINSQRIGL